MTIIDEYRRFLNKKTQAAGEHGFEPIELHDRMFDFQKHLVTWGLRRGRAGIFADCGMGKTLMQLIWADNVRRYTNGNVLIVTPLAVSNQTVREAEQFGIKAARCQDGNHGG